MSVHGWLAWQSPKHLSYHSMIMVGASLEGVRKNPPLLAPFLHVYPSHTTLCGWKVVWGQSPHVYAPFGG